MVQGSKYEYECEFEFLSILYSLKLSAFVCWRLMLFVAKLHKFAGEHKFVLYIHKVCLIFY